MKMIADAEQKPKRTRILAVIASYGHKNINFLKKIVNSYQSMEMDVDIVVLSDAYKDLGEDVELVVGLPSKNPWSLPFAHKSIFAERVGQYDLYIYSEDDIQVTERNILAFQKASTSLNSNEIAGFIRYEVDDRGAWSIPDLKEAYHWKAESVRNRGEFTVAELTNEHSAFYILTYEQLRQAIASGGFLKGPYEGRYDMACTAATDPYTNCGFCKVICISVIEDFFIHHLSNRYAGIEGISLSEFQSQIHTLLSGYNSKHLKSAFSITESKILHGRWSKSYYEKPNDEIFSMLPSEAVNILSVGCGWGATEIKLKQRGALLTAIALDSVIGSTAERLGIDVIYGDIEEAFSSISDRQFDVVLMTNLLHLLPNAKAIIENCAQFVLSSGCILLAGPNFDYLPRLALRNIKWSEYRKLKSFEESGIKLIGISQLRKILSEAGMSKIDVKWVNSSLGWNNKLKVLSFISKYLYREWIILAKR